MARQSRNPVILQKVQSAKTSEVETRLNTALYVRLSVRDNGQPKGRSIANQQALLQKYMETHQELIYYRTYSDNGRSGTSYDRPAFLQMMEAVAKGEIQCILVKDLSRLGRAYLETEYLMRHFFQKQNIRLIAVNDNYDSADRKEIQYVETAVKNLMNDYYAREVSQRIKSALVIKQKKGEFLGSIEPYGYVRSGWERNQLKKDEQVRRVVEEIFARKMKGEQDRQIADDLEQRGILSPGKYLFEKSKKTRYFRYQQASWRYTTVRRILTNPVYCGDTRGQTYYVENTHEGYVDHEIFRNIQQKYEKRK